MRDLLLTVRMRFAAQVHKAFGDVVICISGTPSGGITKPVTKHDYQLNSNFIFLSYLPAHAANKHAQRNLQCRSKLQASAKAIYSMYKLQGGYEQNHVSGRIGLAAPAGAESDFLPKCLDLSEGRP